MIAAAAKALLEAYNQSLAEYNQKLADTKQGSIENVQTYIEEYAKVGVGEIKYRVDGDPDELMRGLINQGYSVHGDKQEDGSFILTINWGNYNAT